MVEATQSIEIETWEFQGGGMGLVAWGVHDPEDFVRAAELEGYDGISPEEVEHVRYVESEDAPEGLEDWYVPVLGEPNATVYHA